MVEIISGEKGKGKTKQLLDRVRGDVKNAQGSIVFLDKNQKHMYELDSKVRLINMADYDVESSDEFLGFLSGVISQNNDIEEIFLDSFLTIGYIDTSEGLVRAVEKLDQMSEKFETNFILSVSKNEKELPDAVKPKIIISL